MEKENNVSLLFTSWLCGGVANAITSAVLNPFDVVKTRMQCSTSHSLHCSMSNIVSHIYKRHGLIGLWTPGLTATMMREMLSSGPRAGFYVPARDYYHSITGASSDDIACKLVAAMCCGTLGAIIANPVDVVKIRLMNNPLLYKGIMHSIAEITKSEGPNALYKGLIASTLRSAFIAAGELGTYDIVKTRLRRYHQRDDMSIHVTASLMTGFVASAVAAPFDLLRARSMNDRGIHQSSLASIVRTTVREEGVTTFFRGVAPAYMRLGPHALICFPIFEQLRRAAGLPYL